LNSLLQALRALPVMTDALLEVRDLRTYFWTRQGTSAAVDGVSFDVRRGRTHCLVGESGSGKTVTSLSILGLIDRSSGRTVGGTVRFDGVELTSMPDHALRKLRGGRMAMIFQEPATCLNPVISVGKQIAEAIRLHRKVSGAEARRRVEGLLAETRIVDPARVAGQFPHELSGGMKQRVMIAMALAGEPDLLIADEPTTALDVTVQAEVLALLRRLQRDRGLAILLITHDLGVVAEMAHDVTVMYAGKVVESGPVANIFGCPRHPYTRGLLASLPRIDRQARPSPIDGVVPPSTNWPKGCRFRERCPDAFAPCEEDPPISEQKESKVACWLHVAPTEPAVP
jgi:peptide/nickel transport system ATP-binding protein